MKNIIVTLILVSIIQQATAQITVRKLDSLIQKGWGVGGQVLPKVPCDTLYKHIANHRKNKNTSVQSESYNILNLLYKRCQEGDSCATIRRKIIDDYFQYLDGNDGAGMYGFITGYLQSARKELTLNDKEKIKITIKSTKRFRSWMYFIKYYGFKEFIPELWKIYEKEPFDEDGRLFSYKQDAISTLIILGDEKAIELQKNMVWKYLNSKPKEITDLVFYSWLDNIRTTKSKEMTELSFDLLKYSRLNNPIIVRAYDGDGEKMRTNLTSQCLLSLWWQVKDYPFSHSYPLKNFKETIEKILLWRKANPNYQIKGFDD